MTKSDFLLKLDELMQLPAGTVHGDEVLAELSTWDSIAMMGYIALVDSTCKKRITGKQIADCATVNDLVTLAGVSA